MGPPSLGHPISPRANNKTSLSAWLSSISAIPFLIIHRFRTGGIRFLLQFALATLGIIVICRILAAEDAGERYRAVFPWSDWSHLEPGVDGSLRIVAFGGQDMLGSGKIEGRKSWLQSLCDELECDELLSMVPDHHEERSIAFKDLYQNSIETLHLNSENADFTTAPASDYLWLKSQYPVPSGPGLVEQIDQFLAMKAPDQAPKHTLWVFTFGYWEIWNLAALPLKTAAEAIKDNADRLVQQLELLNHRAINPDSIAFSDFWFNATDKDIKRLSASDAADRIDPRRLESFRVLIPQLFDISLAPGWQDRPSPNYPHTKSEQLRNAAVLTKMWNIQMKKVVREWTGKAGAKPQVTEKPDGTLELKPEFNDDFEDQRDKEKRDAVHQHAERAVIYAPYPRRMALLAKHPKQLLGSMTEEQMHHSNLLDAAGHGAWPRNDTMRFVDIWTPCIGGSAVDSPDSETVECNSPDDHLFWDRFTVNSRASGEIAKRVAEDVLVKMFRREKRK